ncbi:MAG: hypothetical protein M1815_005409 [Lichina confinis]|nr:MAG: hypothetical protein M1815_005409 [Lichina confinis]
MPDPTEPAKTSKTRSTDMRPGAELGGLSPSAAIVTEPPSRRRTTHDDAPALTPPTADRRPPPPSLSRRARQVDEMPIFEDPDLTGPGDDDEQRMRDDRYDHGRASDQALWTEDAEMWDRPRESRSTSPTKAVLAAVDDASLAVSDRVELIERIKRGESPTWRPNRALEDYYRDAVNPAAKPPEKEGALSGQHPRSPSMATAEPTAEFKLHPASEIERPRSALHSGDFTQESPPKFETHDEHVLPDFDRRPLFHRSQDGAPGSSWRIRGDENLPGPLQHHQGPPPQTTPDKALAPSSPSSPSSPASSGLFPSRYVPTVPTSPLAQGSSQAEQGPDAPEALEPGEPATDWLQTSRRHTLPPRVPQAVRSTSPPGQLPTCAQPEHSPLLARSANLRCQAQFATRSLTASPRGYLPGLRSSYGSAHTRRPSLSSEGPALLHASMVGSYEESILRGRMSTAPSRPLDFVARIGVLGLGDCKPQLRCPAHVSVPFPAVFYSYSKTNVERTSSSEEGPSPYVGLIDLEHSLAKPESPKAENRRRRRSPVSGNCSSREGREDGPPQVPAEAHSNVVDQRLRRRRKKKSRASSSPRAPPGGSYRIPQKGQLQLVIQNPNKTAVKLFLVPYDLEGMEPGTKTFVRQRSYSAGPIIETPLRSSSTADTPDAAAADSDKDRPTLRYLIHLPICCPSRGRFFLYKSIRIVFANRVPDGKEHLRNEIQLPDPRYSLYRPGRESTHGSTPSSSSFRRRSSASGFGLGAGAYDVVDGIDNSARGTPFDFSPMPHTGLPPRNVLRPLSLSGFTFPRTPSDDAKSAENDPSSGRPSEKVLRASPSRQTHGHFTYEPPSGFASPADLVGAGLQAADHDATHTGASEMGFCSGSSILEAPRPSPPPLQPQAQPPASQPNTAQPGEGLLAQRLHGLDVQRRPEHQRGGGQR